MEVSERGRWRGVANVVMFNWHWFVVGFAAILVLAILAILLPRPLNLVFTGLGCLVIAATLVSLVASHIVYDRSDLYRLDWLSLFHRNPPSRVVVLTAGFDEISERVREALPSASVQVYDFFNSERHSEVSIKRARRMYPSSPDTIEVLSGRLPDADGSVDAVILFFAAHEVRDSVERTRLFREVRRVMAPGGKAVVVEHLRDFWNLVIYHLGAFHFFPRNEWLRNFSAAGLVVSEEFDPAPLVKGFVVSGPGA